MSRGLKLIYQNESAECGLACVAMIANFYGYQIDLSTLRQRFSIAFTGATLKDVMTIAEEINISTRAIKLELDQTYDLKCPAILHWNMNHFVVLNKARKDKIEVYDPAYGIKTLTRAELSKHFTGVALELSPTEGFTTKQLKNRLKLSDLWGRLIGLPSALGQLLVLSIILQTLILIAPFYLQLVVDEAVVRYDNELLILLGLSFAFLYIFKSITSLLRSHIVLLFGQQLSYQIIGNVVHHLLRLPLRFFELRHVADLISRIGSVTPIRNSITESIIAAILDIFLAISTAIFMIFYVRDLGLIVILMSALLAALNFSLLPKLRMYKEQSILTGAKEQSHMMENIRAARAIKLFGGESLRESVWRNLYAEFMNANIKHGRAEILLEFIKELVSGLQLVIVLFLGARAVMQEHLSLGVLFAFLAYRQNFTDRVESLIVKSLEFRMLRLHLDRLADIIFTPQEPARSLPLLEHKSPFHSIHLKDISFRYSHTTPYVLKNVSLKINAGEWIAIKGISGGGKSTLLKILLGLVPPLQGEIIVNGMPIEQYGYKAWRRDLGVIMQDDQLLSGTIAENIAFFDPNLDFDWVVECARLACIDGDIKKMPMRYHSLIGDMGSAMSGGQKQRLLLARALYRRPKLLVLDEGTANLDEQSEQSIADVLETMPITKVVVAHRPELIQRADRILTMVNGCLTEQATKSTVTSNIQ